MSNGFSNVNQNSLEDLKERCEDLEEKLQENTLIIEKLCERDIVFQTLPYTMAAFMKGDNIDDGLTNTMGRLERAYGVYAALIIMINDDGRTGTILAHSGNAFSFPERIGVEFTKEFPSSLLKQGHLCKDDKLGNVVKGFDGDVAKKAATLVPMEMRESFQGCLLILDGDDPREWDDVETDSLRRVAATISSFMKLNALMRKLEHDRNNLESVVEERTVDLRKLNATLRNEVSRRKKAQYALKNRHRILKEMYNNVPVGAIIIRKNGQFEYTNVFFRNMTGYAKKELDNLNLYTMLGNKKTTCMDTAGNIRLEIKEIGATLLSKTGKEVDVRISTFPLQSDPEITDGIVCLFTDLGRQQEREHRERMMKIQLTKLTLELEKLKSVITGNLNKPRNMDINTFNLTKREKETLLFALQGYRTREISKRMDVVEVTIRKNLTSIFRKLDVRDRYELIEKYRDLVFHKD